MTISLNVQVAVGTPIHNKILTAVRDRYRFSQEKLASRFTMWQAQDEQAVAYIKDTDANALRKNAKKSSGVLDYVTIEVPYSYGMMLTAHTYLTSVFLGRDPVQQFTGRHGEAQQNVMAVEALMDYQFQVGEHALPHYIWIYDALKYGSGIIGTQWKKEIINYSSIVEVEETFLGVKTGKKSKKRQISQMEGYEGNEVYNIRPYKFFPDPRVPLHRFQEGEFCGVEMEVSWSDILKGQAADEYFNVEQLRRTRPNEGDTMLANSSQIDYPQPYTRFNGDGDAPGFVKCVVMHMNIVPSDWGLGQSTLPEKWVFTLGNDSIIIGARPLGECHDKFPFAVLTSELDGYALTTRGIMEQVQPMNNILTWLFNSHFYNVRSSLNNQFIYDPSKIVSADILDDGPGKRIRLKPDAYGSDVRQVVSQIPVTDVTGNHLGDFTQVSHLMDQMLGINPNLMGMVNPGGRKTATEVRASSSSSTNRLKTIAEIMSAMGYGKLSQMQLQSTQQHYNADKRFKIMGNITDRDPFMQITPDMISGFYDFVPVDGTEPVDRFAQANLWKEILMNIPKLGLQQQYDLPGIFAWTAQLSGMRNIKQFRIKVGDPGQLDAQAQQGNMVPVAQAGGDGSGQPGAMPNLNEPGQIPGVGPTG